MKQLLLFILLCFISCLSYGAISIFYVSYSEGSDTYTTAQAQNPNTAWKTLDKIVSGMNAGTIPAGSLILLKRGDAWLLPRNFNINRSLTFDEYGPGNIKPFVTSLLNVMANGWTLKDANAGIWETTDTIVNPPSNTLNMVIINGKPYAMGRTPNENTPNKGWLNFESHTSTSITDNNNTVFNSGYVGAQIVVRTTHTNIERGTISAVSGNTISFSTSGWGTSVPANGWGYFVQNSLKCLDQFGEWYYNTGTKKLSVCVGPLNNPGNFTVQYPYLDTAIQPRASNITFNHIQIAGANRYMVWNDWSGLSNIAFKACDFGYSGGDLITLMGKRNIVIDSCTATYANSNGYSLGYRDNGVYVTNGSINKIGLFAGMLFKNSQNRYGHGIFYSGQQLATDTGLQCKNMTITNIGYAGIFLGDSRNSVTYTYIDSVCFVQDDGACIYIGNFTSSGTTPKILTGNYFANNILMHALGAKEGTLNNSDNLAHGMYFDDNTNFTVAVNNTFAYNAMAGMYVHNANRNRIENNKSFDNSQFQFYMQDDNIGDSIYRDTVRYNTFMPMNNSELVYYFALGNDSTTLDSKNFNTWGLINNNILAMPFSTNVALLNHFGGILYKTYDLVGWRSTWGYDLASTGMPVTVTDPKQINFVYNTNTVQSNSFSFPCERYISVGNVSYFNSVMLNPMQTEILIYPNP